MSMEGHWWITLEVLGLYSLGFRSFLCLKANCGKSQGAKLQGPYRKVSQPVAKGESPEESEVCIWKVLHTRIGFIPLSQRFITDDFSLALFFLKTRTRNSNWTNKKRLHLWSLFCVLNVPNSPLVNTSAAPKCRPDNRPIERLLSE